MSTLPEDDDTMDKLGVTAPPESDIPSMEKQRVDEDVYVAVLGEVVEILEGLGIPYLFIGGVASAVLGRARWTLDIDLFLRPEDARLALEAFAGSGFATQETDPHWLFKAMKRDVYIDIIFQSSGGIFLDEDMLSRAVRGDFKGCRVQLAPPEDLIVMKALAHSEAAPRYWHDALGMIARADLDWDYLVRRARIGPRRILSLLLYALSNDLVVPEKPLRELFETVTRDGD